MGTATSFPPALQGKPLQMSPDRAADPTALEERGLGYVLAVACSAEVAAQAGKFRAEALAKKLPKRAWQKLSAGRGAKGDRFYDWAVIDLADPAPGYRQLLIRRSRTTRERAYYRCHSIGPAAHPRQDGRLPVEGRGDLPDREGPGRAR
ncbi:hypothetical protein GCM10009612_74350 [Streptomyces beijiangensis]